ncbi:MAG: gas vesicle protein [Cyclobacteriaceae bacterium]
MAQERSVSTHGNSTNLADILERVLDKGIVVAGDINVNIAEIELISIKIRLVICSVDKAKELGINWWQNDPFLSTSATANELEQKNQQLMQRIEQLERKLDV